MNIKTVKQFMEQYKTCVIATVGSSGQPEAATVGISVDGDFKCMIATNQFTRKAVNLAANNNIALVIGFDAPRTLQLEGVAELVDTNAYQSRIDLHLKNVPELKRFAGDASQHYYLITPTWIRFTDYTQSQPVYETGDFT